jgi:subtilisin-like proprotein convertase family protein
VFDSADANFSIYYPATATGWTTPTWRGYPSQPIIITPPIIATTTLANGTVGTAYNQTLSATGGATPYAWSLSGSLPAGLFINSSSGAITGTPTTANTYNFTARCTGANSQYSEQALSITIAPQIAPVPTYSFTNGTGITINDATPAGIAVAASPYPSSIMVSNLPGTLSNLTVTLRAFSHTSPHDVGVLLVGPKGQKIVVMANCDGNNVEGATYTFDDNAVSGMPEYPTVPIPSGTYKPSNWGDSSFPTGAPAGPYQTALSVCNGAPPNGTWSLYVQDDCNGDSGSIAGWSLAFNLLTPPQPPVITSQPQDQTVVGGQTSTFSVIASNAQFYVWRTNGVALTEGGRFLGTTSPNLVMTGTVTNDSARLFSCVVSNANGSVTSSNALLTVVSPSTPFFTGAAFANGSFQATLNGAPMSNYIVLVSSDLASWKTLQTVTSPSGRTNISDAGAGRQVRFYRAKLAP